MRYYEYLSTAKVEMLYPQVDRSSRSAGSEVGIDLKVIRASRKTDGRKPPSIHDKLATVEEWIYTHEPVGSPDEPDVWIYGRTDLLATTLNLTDESGLVAGRFQGPGDTDTGPVLFTPSDGTQPDFLMGGSAHNLSARRAYPDMPLPPQMRFTSSPIMLLAALGAVADELGIGMSADSGELGFAGDCEMIGELAAWIRTNAGSGPRQHPAAGFRVSPPTLLGECEFLAKRLRVGPSTHLVTLATPLFVALLD